MLRKGNPRELNRVVSLPGSLEVGNVGLTDTRRIKLVPTVKLPPTVHLLGNLELSKAGLDLTRGREDQNLGPL
jgi:hypothetical protein